MTSSLSSNYRDRYYYYDNATTTRDTTTSQCDNDDDNGNDNKYHEDFYIARIMVNNQNSSSIIIPRQLAIRYGFSKSGNAVIYPESNNSIRIKRLNVTSRGSIID
jgi:hypothetical protein